MDPYIPIATLNDFLFCPKSIYYHQLYGKYHAHIYKDTSQIVGSHNHASIDTKTYSSSKDIVQALDVFSAKYGLVGKIDLLHIAKKSLMERKTHIKKIYPGYVTQVYAQYFCLIEMGYEVEHIKLYSLTDNKVYAIPLPTAVDIASFEALVGAYRSFRPDTPGFVPVPAKCAKCIYRELCDSYAD